MVRFFVPRAPELAVWLASKKASASVKLGLSWTALNKAYPQLSMVAVAALEPGFAAVLCRAADMPPPGMAILSDLASHTVLVTFMAPHTQRLLDPITQAHKTPLYRLSA